MDYYVAFPAFVRFISLAELQPERQGKRRRKGNFWKNQYLQNYVKKILVNSALLLLWTPFVLWSLPRVKRGAHKEKWQWDPSLLYKDLLLPVSTADLKHPKRKFKFCWDLVGPDSLALTAYWKENHGVCTTGKQVAVPELVEVGGVNGAEAWSCRSCVWYILKAGRTGIMG